MDKKEFEKKLKEKKAKAGEVETIEGITSGEIVKEAQEPERLGIITTADVLGIERRSTDRSKTIITTANVEAHRACYLKEMEEKKNDKD